MTVPHAILIYAMYIFQIDKKKLEVNDRILIPKTTLSAMYKTNKKTDTAIIINKRAMGLNGHLNIRDSTMTC